MSGEMMVGRLGATVDDPVGVNALSGKVTVNGELIDVEHVFAGVAQGSGRYFQSAPWRGWPTMGQLATAARDGFDRYEVWTGGRVLWQAPTIAGRVPVGWPSLQSAGYVREFVRAMHP
jgi:hypothetical protein